MSRYSRPRPLQLLLVPAAALALLSSCEGTEPAAVPFRLQLSDSVVQISDGATAQLSATVLDQNGKAMSTLPAGVQLVWASRDTSIATVKEGLVTAKRSGQTQVTAAVGELAASARVMVRAVPSAVRIVRGDSQVAVITQPLPDSLVVRVLDRHGQAVPGVTVQFAVSEGGGAVAPAQQATDSAGYARTSWKLGESVGAQRVTATAAGQTVAFTATGRSATPNIALQLVASGLAFPTFLTSPPGDDRLYVTERAGRVKIIKGGEVLSEPFLDLSSKTGTHGEEGMFSLAFHPQYPTNRYVYVSHTYQERLRIVRFTANADGTRADPASEKVVLALDAVPAHFGGMIEFGPDGRLYISTGEGGSVANAQNKGNLFGKILRIDVNAGDSYSIPADNPFVGEEGARGEIWALGLRNPWRLGIDHVARTLYTGDVGHNHWEEINVAPLNEGGRNFGWPVMEGALCFPETKTDCNRAGLTLPTVAYPHGERGTGHPYGCSVTGGFVYRGSRMPELRGHYVYGDFCRSWVRTIRYQNGTVTEARDWPFEQAARLISFGQDSSGEIYLLSSTGRVFRIVPAS